jgi:hypothetical protein
MIAETAVKGGNRCSPRGKDSFSAVIFARFERAQFKHSGEKSLSIQQVRLEHLIFTQRCILNSMSRSSYVSQPPSRGFLLASLFDYFVRPE